MRRTILERCSGGVACVDVFGAPAPWWWGLSAAPLLQRPPEATTATTTTTTAKAAPVALLTRAHLRQLRLSAEKLAQQAACQDGRGDASKSAVWLAEATRGCYAFPRVASDAESVAARACLAHARLRCEISLTRGDARVVHDTAPFLSCRGRALATEDDDAQQRMRVATQQFHYELPFWLSLADLEQQQRYQIFPFRALSASEMLSLGGGLFQDSSRAVCLVNDRGVRDTVVNVAELWRHPPNELERSALFSTFRRFSPVNVATHAAFPPMIEDAIRAECSHSGCWCTVWGTESDFADCSAPSLCGALGIYVFDEAGEEMFLTNALCCEDFLRAFTAVYPDQCIYCVF